MSFLTQINLKISGDFRSGIALTEFDEKIFPLLNLTLSIVNINLHDVSFMDSGSMSSIRFAERHGANLIWENGGYVYERYLQYKSLGY